MQATGGGGGLSFSFDDGSGVAFCSERVRVEQRATADMPNWPEDDEEHKHEEPDSADHPSALLLARALEDVRQLQQQFATFRDLAGRRLARLEAREGFRSACCPACSLAEQDAACRRMQCCFARAVLRGRRARAAAALHDMASPCSTGRGGGRRPPGVAPSASSAAELDGVAATADAIAEPAANATHVATVVVEASATPATARTAAASASALIAASSERQGIKGPLGGAAADECAGCGKARAAGTKLRRCSRCRLVFYCDTKCQRAHRRTHKPSCIKPTPPVVAGAALPVAGAAVTSMPVTEEEQEAVAEEEKEAVTEECPICLEPLLGDIHSPTRARLFCCGKQTCVDCKNGCMARKIFRCPMCRSAVPRSPEEEVNALLPNAVHGQAWAQNSLAVCFATGRGVKRDLKQAFEL